MAMVSYATLFSARALGLYSVVSAASFLITLYQALVTYPTFYQVTVYLQDSRLSVLVLLNCVVCATIVTGRIAQLVLFGRLRSNETDALKDSFFMHLYTTVVQYMTLNLSISPGFILAHLAAFLLGLGSTLVSERIKTIEQIATFPRFFFVRLTTAVVTVLVAQYVLTTGAVVGLLLAPEQGHTLYLFAAASIAQLLRMFGIVLKFACAAYEYSLGRPWQFKKRVLAYGGLAISVAMVASDVAIIALPLMLGVIPNAAVMIAVGINALSHLTGFVQRVTKLYRFHEATQNLDERYPTVPAAEVQQMSDPTCIICREEFEAVSENPQLVPKRLGCGHVFHSQCLVSWLEWQQSCPTCRQTVFEAPARRSAQQASQTPQAQPAVQGADQLNVPSLAAFAERIRAVTEDAPQDRRRQQLAQRLFHNDALNPRTASGVFPREQASGEHASSSAHEEPREAVRRAVLSRYGTEGAGSATEVPVLIPLFDPSDIPEYFNEHVPQLPHTLAPWVRP